MGKVGKARKKLLGELEAMIGRECYNSNIQNYGPGGEWEGEGRDFRYPVTYINKHRSKVKTRALPADLSYDELRTAYYAFGANELHIMLGLEAVLEHLEKNYGLRIES
jgi:hypothetical protein